MAKTYSLLLALGIMSASLASCSRSNYAFNNTAPAYLGSEQAVASVPAAVAETPVATPKAAVQVVPSSHSYRVARPKAHHKIATASVNAKAKIVAPTTVLTASHPVKISYKAVKQVLKSQLAADPSSTMADGKSQTTALILCVLLGGIGVHQFYLGYTGRGLLRILLALTSFLILPAIVNLILYILDIIKIANGDLKPKDGDYAKKFGG